MGDAGKETSVGVWRDIKARLGFGDDDYDDYDEYDEVEDDAEDDAIEAADEAEPVDWRADGPFDSEEVDLGADGVARIDLGSLIVTP